MIVSDHGTSSLLLAWCQDSKINWHFIAPEKPMQNVFIESLNGGFRDELINELFFDIDNARARIIDRLTDHSDNRSTRGV